MFRICFVFLQVCTLIPKGVNPSKVNKNKFETQIHKLLKQKQKGFTNVLTIVMKIRTSKNVLEIWNCNEKKMHLLCNFFFCKVFP